LTVEFAVSFSSASRFGFAASQVEHASAVHVTPPSDCVVVPLVIVVGHVGSVPPATPPVVHFHTHELAAFLVELVFCTRSPATYVLLAIQIPAPPRAVHTTPPESVVVEPTV
jgi:hypothetical protein